MKLLPILFLIIASIGSAASVYACTCTNPRRPCDATSKSAAVFVGTVVSGKNSNPAQKSDFNTPVEFKFSVEEAFKGLSSTEVSVFTSWGGCGYPFQIGQQYLVYAYKDEKDGRLATSLCSRTSQLSEAKDDLAYLRVLSQVSSGSMILGDVMRFKRDENGNGSSAEPMPNIKITVTGEGKKLEVESDAKGRFSISGLKPGAYFVSIDLPPSLTSGENERSITLEDKACESLYFGVESNGRLTGQVKNILGVPIEKAAIFIVPANKPRYTGWWDAAYSGKDGIYSFKRIPPGKYKLQIRFDGLTRQTRPFPIMYHPGVLDTTQATVIEIGEGQETKDYNVVVPELPKDRTIEGIVVSSDGTLLKDAKVSYSVESVVYAASMDSLGHFKLSVYEGVSTVLQARVERNGKQVQSEWFTIPETGDVEKVKLVIPVP